jgi:hemerythrin superfamily protein
MDAIKLLKGQHRDVEKLFEAFESAGTKEKQALFDRIADALAVHATIEEKIFYPAAKSEKTKDLLQEAVEEHLSVKRLIADLMELSPSDESFDAKVKVLKEQVEHHVEEEETEMFPKTKSTLDAATLEELGAQMESMAGQLEAAGRPRDAVPGETDQASPLG